MSPISVLYPFPNVCVREVFKEKCYFVEPSVSLPGVSGHGQSRFSQTSDSTGCHQLFPATLVPARRVDLEP